MQKSTKIVGMKEGGRGLHWERERENAIILKLLERRRRRRRRTTPSERKENKQRRRRSRRKKGGRIISVFYNTIVERTHNRWFRSSLPISLSLSLTICYYSYCALSPEPLSRNKLPLNENPFPNKLRLLREYSQGNRILAHRILSSRRTLVES